MITGVGIAGASLETGVDSDPVVSLRFQNYKRANQPVANTAGKLK